MIDPIEKSLVVPLTPDRAFDLFTNRIASWWPLDKHSLSAGDGKVARNISITPELGGDVTEVKHDGTSVVWGKVLSWEPGKTFAMSWQLDRPADEATRLEISFAPDNTGTRVTLLHDGWDAIPEPARAARSHYSSGWDYVLCDRFKSAAE